MVTEFLDLCFEAVGLASPEQMRHTANNVGWLGGEVEQSSFFFLKNRRPPRSPLFPHPPLFRSRNRARDAPPSRANRRGSLLEPRLRVHELDAELIAGLPTQHDLRPFVRAPKRHLELLWGHEDRKSTRLNSSHLVISYAVFCLKK